MDAIEGLEGGFLLRRATAAETEALVEFNAAIHGGPASGPDHRIGVWTRGLLTRPDPRFCPRLSQWFVRVCPWSAGAGGRRVGASTRRRAVGSRPGQRKGSAHASLRGPAPAPGTGVSRGPWAGAALLAHVSAAAAARYGVAIQAEAVLDGAHALLLVVEAAQRAQVERVMAVFARSGSAQVWPASSAQEAVARGGCAAGTGAGGRFRNVGGPNGPGAPGGQSR